MRALDFLSASIAPRTKQTYTSAWKSYSTFCASMQLERLPITEMKLIYFCTHLATNNLAHKSIQVYISGLSFHGTLYGYPFQFSSMNTLYLIMRGIRRRQGNSLTRVRRAPITIQLLHRIRQYLSIHFSTHDRHMVWSAVTLAFFGLLRSAEYTSPTTTCPSNDTLTLSDVSMFKNKMLINIRASKTDQFRQGTVIRFFRLPSPLCPVAAMEAFLQYRIGAGRPLYRFANGTLLTRQWVSRFLADVFPLLNNINTHSFRIGGATAAASNGVSDAIIQTMGRWNSDCFQRYIRVSDTEIAYSQRRMGSVMHIGRIWDSEELCSRESVSNSLDPSAFGR